MKSRKRRQRTQQVTPQRKYCAPQDSNTIAGPIRYPARWMLSHSCKANMLPNRVNAATKIAGCIKIDCRREAAVNFGEGESPWFCSGPGTGLHSQMKDRNQRRCHGRGIDRKSSPAALLVWQDREHQHGMRSVFRVHKGIFGILRMIFPFPMDEFKDNMVLLMPVLRL